MFSIADLMWKTVAHGYKYVWSVGVGVCACEASVHLFAWVCISSVCHHLPGHSFLIFVYLFVCAGS